MSDSTPSSQPSGAPGGTSPPTPSPPAAPTSRLGPTAKLLFQIVGFLLCIAALAWVVHGALQDPESFRKLGQATAGQIAAMVGCTLVIIFASGATFRETLLPVRRLSMLEVQATNVIACLLVLVPFKLSAIFRVLIHNRRDGVPLFTIGAWFGAVGVVILAVLCPMLLAGIWRRQADTAWFIAAGGGTLACLLAILLFARFLRSDAGWALAQGWYARLPLPTRLRPGTPLATTLFEKSHEGVRMLASPRVVFGCAAYRLIDFAAQAARIALAAAIIGEPMHWSQALLAGSIFFLITAAAPSGALGAREGGTAWLVTAVLPTAEPSHLKHIVLAVSATEVVVLLVGAALGVAYLRPDRILRAAHTRAA